MAGPERLKTDDVQAAMRKTWCAPEYALVWEVAPATGAAHGRQRYADAMIMSLWPSRGQYLHGVEIKVSRSDWLREAKDPSKAERLAAYCDYWWVHTVPGVIHDLAEVPIMWGVRVWDGKRWSTLREAKRTDAQPVDRGFLASLMRRGDEQVEAAARAKVQNVIEAERANIQQQIDSGIRAHTARSDKALDAIRKFKETSGIDLLGSERDFNIPDPRRLGAIVKVVHSLGLLSSYSSLDHMIREIGGIGRRFTLMHEEATASLAELNAPMAEAIEAGKAEVAALDEADRAKNRRR